MAAAIQLGATPVAIDDRGVPRLLRGSDTAPALAAAKGADAATAARSHVARLAPAWGVKGNAVPGLEIAGEVKTAAGTVVRMRQMIDGIPIDPTAGGEVRVLLGEDGALKAASGKLVATTTSRTKASFRDDDRGAVARAVNDVYGTKLAGSALATKSVLPDGGRLLAAEADDVHVSMSRARQVWYPTADGLVAAWVVEAYASKGDSTAGDAFRRVIAAEDGKVLARHNLVADANFNYRVFAEPGGERHPFDGPIVDSVPHPTGIFNTTQFPAAVPPNLVTVDGLNRPNGGGAPPDPWLVAGRLETLGNNVDAYTDVRAPDGLSFGDFRATVTGPATFDRVFDTAQGALVSQDQQMAGATQLFFLINWLHDFWYDAGFTEPAGNAQNNNFGRGGEDRDALLAESQDNALGGSRNNANMATPSDGIPPRMQVFIWNGKANRSLTFQNRQLAVGGAGFGPAVFNATGELAVANDGAGVLSDACTPLVGTFTGKIVVVDRGSCSFRFKALQVQNAGGAGMVLVNNAPGVAPPGLGDDPTVVTAITIGSLSLLQTDGTQLKADIAAAPAPIVATVSAAPPAPELDGSLDGTVIAHEFGHYLHHRLSVCNTVLCGAMSEGWGDFVGLMFSARAGDNFDGAFPTGTYSTQSFAADPTYFGIRRIPYSVRPNINALSFRHMGDGAAAPTEHPFNGGGPNSEVHNAGEIWASMLWEGYVALLKAGPSFEEIRLRMRQYVVTGLLIAPPDGTPTEVRDAILIAARAVNRRDHDILAAAFAKRGFGSCAVSPDRESTTFPGIVESFAVSGRMVAGAVASERTKTCDSDSVLDAGEVMVVTVPVANAGPQAATNVSVALRSSLPGVEIVTAPIPLGTVAAYSTDTTVSFEVRLADSVTTILESDLKVEISGNNACGTLALPLVGPLNSDDLPASSATETFNAVTSAWTIAGTGGIWSHTRPTGLDGEQFGKNPTATADASLISPPLTAGTQPVQMTFTHRFGFEFAPAQGANPAQPFDGGVLEISLDNGTTWTDVSLFANPGYTQTLVSGGSNPLAGRRAYGNVSPSFPQNDEFTLFFGTRLANRTFRLRFRIGADSNTGGFGWQIDDIQFRGLTNTPFPTLVPDAGRCVGEPPVVGDGEEPPVPDVDVPLPPGKPPVQGPLPPRGGDGGDDDELSGCQVGGSGAGGAGALFGLLGVLLRRRRR